MVEDQIVQKMEEPEDEPIDVDSCHFPTEPIHEPLHTRSQKNQEAPAFVQELPFL